MAGSGSQIVEWDTLGLIGLILPVDALLVSYFTYLFIRRGIKNMWKEEQAKKKAKKWWPW